MLRLVGIRGAGREEVALNLNVRLSAATCAFLTRLGRVRLKLSNKRVVHKTPPQNQTLALASDVVIPLMDLL